MQPRNAPTCGQISTDIRTRMRTNNCHSPATHPCTYLQTTVTCPLLSNTMSRSPVSGQIAVVVNPQRPPLLRGVVPLQRTPRDLYLRVLSRGVHCPTSTSVVAGEHAARAVHLRAALSGHGAAGAARLVGRENRFGEVKLYGTDERG